jgi:NAD(P)H dehydrogenase (quinone)
MIVVTGANGRLGRLIVTRLLGRVPAETVGVSVRDAAQAADLAALGVRVREASYDDPSALASAFEGATQLLMVSSNSSAHGGDTLGQHRVAIGVAQAAGVRRIVYTSQMAAAEHSRFPPARLHAATEALLAASGLAWTALRNGFYADSGVDQLRGAFATGVIEAAADGPVAWTTHADLATAAARVLTDEGRFEGPTPPLTAMQALDLGDLARIASGVLGRHIERRVLDDDAFRAQLAARHLPLPVIEIVAGMYQASRHGEFDKVDATLSRLLGREPEGIAQVIAARVETQETGTRG